MVTKNTSPTYDRLRTILLRYQSPAVVDSLLAVSCRKVGVDPREVSLQHVEGILHELSHGVRAFCAPEQLGQMMVELAALAAEHP